MPCVAGQGAYRPFRTDRGKYLRIWNVAGIPPSLSCSAQGVLKATQFTQLRTVYGQSVQWADRHRFYPVTFKLSKICLYFRNGLWFLPDIIHCRTNSAVNHRYQLLPGPSVFGGAISPANFRHYCHSNLEPTSFSTYLSTNHLGVKLPNIRISFKASKIWSMVFPWDQLGSLCPLSTYISVVVKQWAALLNYVVLARSPYHQPFILWPPIPNRQLGDPPALPDEAGLQLRLATCTQGAIKRKERGTSTPVPPDASSPIMSYTRKK